MKQGKRQPKRSTGLKLGPHEHIRCAYPHVAQGPGWSNYMVYVVIFDGSTRRYREACVQFTEFNHDMHTLFGTCAVASNALKKAVEALIDGR